MKLKLIVSYDGSAFSGWQSQADGSAVQDRMERAFANIVGSRVVVHGSGRTDAGVHALGQCAHVDVPDGALDPSGWLRAINAHLPPTVRIMRATRAPSDFHSRFSAKGKVYRYLIRNGPVLPPLEIGRVWHVPQHLNKSILQTAARIFVGRHDFAAFAANRGKKNEDTTRTIHRINVRADSSLISLTFEGEGFLYKMVRMLTGALVRVSQDRESIDDLKSRLSSGTPRWNHVAPADGLTLVRVIY